MWATTTLTTEYKHLLIFRRILLKISSVCKQRKRSVYVLHFVQLNWKWIIYMVAVSLVVESGHYSGYNIGMYM